MRQRIISCLVGSLFESFNSLVESAIRLREFRSLRFAFAVVVLLVVSLSQGKDTSLSELPSAVRATIERETKGFAIEEINRDNDDGKVVYEVEADGDTGEMKLKITAEGTLVEKEQQMDSDSLPAAVFEAGKKEFGDVYLDDIEKRFRRGRTNRDLKNVEYPVEKVVYCIDDVKTDN